MFPRNYYLKKKYSVLLDAFRNLAKELAIVLGAGTDVEKQANDIVSFEIELAKVRTVLINRDYVLYIL